MKLIKNLIKIVILAAVMFASLLSCIPAEWVALNVWPFTIPMFFIIGAYCYTYKTDPLMMVKKFMSI